MDKAPNKAPKLTLLAINLFDSCNLISIELFNGRMKHNPYGVSVLPIQFWFNFLDSLF